MAAPAEKVSNIVHICSSDTYPLMNKAVHSHIGAYLSIDPVENPGQTLVKDGNYSVDWIKHRSSFNLRCASRRIKLEAIKGVLQLQGKSRQGKKVCCLLYSLPNMRLVLTFAMKVYPNGRLEYL